MAQNFRVIQCPVAELADKLNELSPEFSPFVFNFSADNPASIATVVCVRQPKQQIAMTIPPGDWGRGR